MYKTPLNLSDTLQNTTSGQKTAPSQVQMLLPPILTATEPMPLKYCLDGDFPLATDIALISTAVGADQHLVTTTDSDNTQVKTLNIM